MGIALDLSTIPNVYNGKKHLDPVEYIELCKKKGFIFYHGNKGYKPILLDGEEIELVDIDTLEGKKRWDELLKNKP